jgi:hypothetical protein
MGEIGRQIKHGFNGWKVPPHDAGSVISILNSLIEDRSGLPSIKANFKKVLAPTVSYPERMRALFEQILLGQHELAPNRRLTLKQVEWLGNKMPSYPAEAATWANGPLAFSNQATQPTPPAFSGLITPRQAFGRFMFYLKQRGVVGAMKIFFEWIRK